MQQPAKHRRATLPAERRCLPSEAACRATLPAERHCRLSASARHVQLLLCSGGGGHSSTGARGRSSPISQQLMLCGKAISSSRRRPSTGSAYAPAAAALGSGAPPEAPNPNSQVENLPGEVINCHRRRNSPKFFTNLPKFQKQSHVTPTVTYNHNFAKAYINITAATSELINFTARVTAALLTPQQITNVVTPRLGRHQAVVPEKPCPLAAG